MLDAASRTARWFKVESSKMKKEREEADNRELTVPTRSGSSIDNSKSKGEGKRSEKDNAETPRAQR